MIFCILNINDLNFMGNRNDIFESFFYYKLLKFFLYHLTFRILEKVILKIYDNIFIYTSIIHLND